MKIFIVIFLFYNYVLGDCDLELFNFEERIVLMFVVEMDDIRMVRYLIKVGENVKLFYIYLIYVIME